MHVVRISIMRIHCVVYETLHTINKYNLPKDLEEIMRVLVTGSSGHLGEALVITLSEQGHDVIGIDIIASPSTTYVGSITDRNFLKEHMTGIEVVFHTATLHKPHVSTHTMQNFVDTNVSGTLNLLEESLVVGVSLFVFTSTTSAFGDALVPSENLPAAWITEETVPIPKNIYGVTKVAAEDLCHLFYRNHGLPVIILRTSRFFQEEDDNVTIRDFYSDANLKLNEYLYRRVDIEDAVDAHLCAMNRGNEIGFGKFIISATTPFKMEHLQELRHRAPDVVSRLCPAYSDVYARHEWKMCESIDRVYVNALAREKLGWKPKHDFVSVLSRVALVQSGAVDSSLVASDLAKRIGAKGYHK